MDRYYGGNCDKIKNKVKGTSACLKRTIQEVWEKGKVIDFVVQLEIKVKGEWKPVIRFDCSHDFTHIDRYNLKGEKEKIELYLDYAEALTIADEDININWESYKERFLRGDYP